MCNLPDSILTFLAVLLPPAVAHIKTGRHDLTLSIILTLFGWLPGILHAWYLIVKNPDHHRRQGPASMDGYAEGSYVEAQTPPYPHAHAYPHPEIHVQPQLQPQRREQEEVPKDMKLPPIYGR